MVYNKNLTHYISATAIIVKEGKFLIAKRASWEKAFPSRWTVPGGKLEVLDYVLKEKDSKYQWYNVLENLVRREVEEEVKLKIKNIGYVTSLVLIRNDEVPALVISLWAEPEDPNAPVILDKSLTDYRWVTLEESKNYDLIEGIYEELEVLDNMLKTGEHHEWKKHDNNPY